MGNAYGMTEAVERMHSALNPQARINHIKMTGVLDMGKNAM